MIKSFDHKGLGLFYETGSTRGIQPKQAIRISLILDRLNAAVAVSDMSYPGSGFHALKGKYKGYYAVSVSGNWRIIFCFENGHAEKVGYLDYH